MNPKTALLMKRIFSKQTVQLIAAYLTALFGMVMITVALVLPPLGVIGPSVLTAFGEVLTFSGALLGMDYHYRFRGRED